MRRIFIFILILGFVGFGGVALYSLAQTGEADLSITVIPNNPEPGTEVILQVSSYGADLDQATLTWSYNGTQVASSTGRRSITVIAPTAGAIGTISVTASGGGFAATTASVTLRPASIDMLWEAVGASVPPFYKGKALLTDGAVMRVTALPSGVAPTTLVYNWSRNNSALPDLSGFGKSSITFAQNILNRSESVAVEARGGAFFGNGNIVAIPASTSILAYKNKEGFVDYTSGFATTIPVRENGAVLHFEPYYFSTPRGALNDLEVTMTSGGTQIDQSSNPFELAIARPDEGGESALTVAIDTVIYSLQHAEKIFTVQFD